MVVTVTFIAMVSVNWNSGLNSEMLLRKRWINLGVKMFDPESLMFQTDWKPLEDWFRRRAEEAVVRGEISNIYQHREVIIAESIIDPKIGEAAYQLGYNAGKFVANLLKSKEM
jgi:hypothetical protein